MVISCVCYWKVTHPVILKLVLEVKAVILDKHVTGLATMSFIVALLLGFVAVSTQFRSVYAIDGFPDQCIQLST